MFYAPKTFNLSDYKKIENYLAQLRELGAEVSFDFTGEARIVREVDGVQVRVLDNVKGEIVGKIPGSDIKYVYPFDLKVAHPTGVVERFQTMWPEPSPVAASMTNAGRLVGMYQVGEVLSDLGTESLRRYGSPVGTERKEPEGGEITYAHGEWQIAPGVWVRMSEPDQTYKDIIRTWTDPSVPVGTHRVGPGGENLVKIDASGIWVPEEDLHHYPTINHTPAPAPGPTPNPPPPPPLPINPTGAIRFHFIRPAAVTTAGTALQAQLAAARAHASAQLARHATSGAVQAARHAAQGEVHRRIVQVGQSHIGAQRGINTDVVRMAVEASKRGVPVRVPQPIPTLVPPTHSLARWLEPPHPCGTAIIVNGLPPTLKTAQGLCFK
jgi:hypothetical protein